MKSLFAAIGLAVTIVGAVTVVVSCGPTATASGARAPQGAPGRLVAETPTCRIYVVDVSMPRTGLTRLFVAESFTASGGITCSVTR